MKDIKAPKIKYISCNEIEAMIDEMIENNKEKSKLYNRNDDSPIIQQIIMGIEAQITILTELRDKLKEKQCMNDIKKKFDEYIERWQKEGLSYDDLWQFISSEIKSMIDEMIEKNEKTRANSEDRLTRVSFEGSVLALTELRDKL